MAGDERAYVTLARVLRARGCKGEVAAEILTDFPERLTRLREVFLLNGRGERRPAAVRECWLHRGQAIFHFENAESIADAEQFRGCEVQAPLAERVTLPAGRYYVTDLIGCEVFEQGESGRCGATLGRVRDVQLTGEAVAGTPLLVVETGEGEMLIPLAEEFCRRIDTAARLIEVALPEGLRELNRE